MYSSFKIKSSEKASVQLFDSQSNVVTAWDNFSQRVLKPTFTHSRSSSSRWLTALYGLHLDSSDVFITSLDNCSDVQIFDGGKIPDLSQRCKSKGAEVESHWIAMLISQLVETSKRC